jgi:hypothetical protein
MRMRLCVVLDDGVIAVPRTQGDEVDEALAEGRPAIGPRSPTPSVRA